MMQEMRKKRRNPVVGCLLPILGLLVFVGVCYGVCLVLFLVGNPGAASPGATGGWIATVLMG